MVECKGFLIDEDCNIFNKRTGGKLKPFIGTDGYYQVSRRSDDGTLYHARVHVLLATAFIPNPNNFKYVNHIDSNKLNNNLSNLEWCTNSYNVKHGWESGNRTHKNRTKVKAIDVNGNVYIFNSIRELGRELHLDRHKVARILKGEVVNHYDYEFDYIKSNDYRKDM